MWAAMSDLQVRGLTVRYGGVSAVTDVDLEVDSGSLVALVGPNGAGKSSCVRAIMGLVPATGSVSLHGREVLSSPAHRRAALRVGFVPEGRGVVPGLSVRENLLLGAYRAPRGRRGIVLGEVLDFFPVLRVRLGQLAGTLSGGEQQMLAIGRAMMVSPRILILDEPSMGLAPAIARDLFRQLRVIADQGAAVLVSDENAALAMPVADKVTVLRLGRVTMRGTPAELSDGSLLAHSYFGT
jgi:branched-chain amino acid transport system ATP-binding protein